MMPITGYLSLRIPQAGLELMLGFFLIALGLYYMFFAKNLRIAPTPGAEKGIRAIMLLKRIYVPLGVLRSRLR